MAVTSPVVVLNLALLIRIEKLVKVHDLHDLPSPGPVDISPAIEEYQQAYRDMPYYVQAMTVRWRESAETVTIFNLNGWLEALEASADLRHARAHEFAHVLLGHKGTQFIMWSAEVQARCEGLESYMSSKQEHQCECISSLLLVPVWMLQALDSDDRGYIAATLDVPEHLVTLRWEIYQKLGR